jgi:hypothetical protein
VEGCLFHASHIAALFENEKKKMTPGFIAEVLGQTAEHSLVKVFLKGSKCIPWKEHGLCIQAVFANARHDPENTQTGRRQFALRVQGLLASEYTGTYMKQNNAVL